MNHIYFHVFPNIALKDFKDREIYIVIIKSENYHQESVAIMHNEYSLKCLASDAHTIQKYFTFIVFYHGGNINNNNNNNEYKMILQNVFFNNNN